MSGCGGWFHVLPFLVHAGDALQRREKLRRFLVADHLGRFHFAAFAVEEDNPRRAEQVEALQQCLMFFLVGGHSLELSVPHVDRLTDFAWRVRQELEHRGITGEGGGVIDHIELVGLPADPANHARNFVLCPGKAYDRSPCGTGTSAKLACLYERGELTVGQRWKQESIVGSLFEGWVDLEEGKIIPTVQGRAYVNSTSQLILNPQDPFCDGIRAD